jgi:hypothetical protein
MQIFEYVIVLISIVIGLAVTHLMQGIAGLIQHPDRARIWWVHLGWVALWLLNAMFWWWWEFRLQLIRDWTFQLYLFVLCYAFLIYLVCAMLFPRDLEGYDGFKDYLLSRRRWIFGLMLLILAVDLVDTLAKGTAYFAAQGAAYLAMQGIYAALCLTAFVTRRERVHAAIVLVVLAMQAVRITLFYNTLA